MLFASCEIRAHGGELITYPMKCALAYSAFIFVPVTAWYFYAHTGWSSVYLIPENEIQFWMGPSYFLQYFSGMVFGTWLAQLLIQRGQRKAVFFTLFLGVVWLLGTFGMTLNQYLHVGTFDQYYQGRASGLFSPENQDFLDKLNIMGAAIILPAAALAYHLLKRSKSI